MSFSLPFGSRGIFWPYKLTTDRKKQTNTDCTSNYGVRFQLCGSRICVYSLTLINQLCVRKVKLRSLTKLFGPPYSAITTSDHLFGFHQMTGTIELISGEERTRRGDSLEDRSKIRIKGQKNLKQSTSWRTSQALLST